MKTSEPTPPCAVRFCEIKKIGVRECWFVSLEAATVEVLQLTPKGMKRLDLYGMGDAVRSKVLSGLELLTTKLFA